MKARFEDLESEKMLVCQMVLKPDIMAEVFAMVKPEAFVDQDYKKAYEYLIRMFNAGNKIDASMFTVGYDEISLDKRMAITEATFTAANWRFYAERIRNNYVARTCLETCRTICGGITADNAAESVSRLSGVASDILDSAGTGGRHVFGDVVADYVRDMDYRMLHRGELAGYDTGLQNLNEMLNGLQSEYIIIAARPSMGKTALGEQIALKIAEKEKVCFWELEMGEKMMFERAVSLSSGVEMNKLKSAFMSEMQLNAVMGKIQSLGTNENFILRTGTRNIDEIVTATRAEVLSRGCKAVFIDHAGLISTSGSYRATWESYVEISHKLQELQRELNVPVVVLSQLGRPAEGAKTTTMANIKGSGAFEEDADVIIAIERERAKASNEFQIPTVLNVQKNRNGPTGHVYAVFMPQKVKFVDGKKPEERDGTGEAKKAV